jgi:hypothetical protein
MKTALALVLMLGAIGGGIAVSNPPKQGRHKIATQPVVALNQSAKTAIAGVPAGPPISPRGWVITSPNGSAAVARMVKFGANGWQDLGDPLSGGGMVGSNSGGDTMFASPSVNRGHAWIIVRVNGSSEAHLPGRSGFGVGPSTPGGNFTLSNGITVTAVP